MDDPPDRNRYILHADLDAFYASVEQKDNPQLRGKPVVVGGPPESRGVVAAASYEARKFGIHSAMPMRTAARLCHSLVRVSPRFQRYGEVSAQIMGLFSELTPLVEPLSLDEAYMDVSEEPDFEEVARRLKNKIREVTGLAVTIGGGTSKTVAKVASQLGKPDGMLLIRQGDERSFLAPLKVVVLTGVGPKTASLLKSHGVNTVGDIAACDVEWLRTYLGVKGPVLRDRALGIDNNPVTPHRETKSVSAETTLSRDTGNLEEINSHIRDLSERVAAHLRRSKLKGRTVKLKLRLSDFTTFTRQTTMRIPTDDPDLIHQAAMQLLTREYRTDHSFRLFGVGVSKFEDSGQLPLFFGPGLNFICEYQVRCASTPKTLSA